MAEAELGLQRPGLVLVELGIQIQAENEAAWALFLQARARVDQGPRVEHESDTAAREAKQPKRAVADARGIERGKARPQFEPERKGVPVVVADLEKTEFAGYP